MPRGGFAHPGMSGGGDGGYTYGGGDYDGDYDDGSHGGYRGYDGDHGGGKIHLN